MLKNIILPIILLSIAEFSHAGEEYSYISSSPKTESRGYKMAQDAQRKELERISKVYGHTIMAVQGEDGISYFDKTPEKTIKAQPHTNNLSRAASVAKKLSF